MNTTGSEGASGAEPTQRRFLHELAERVSVSVRTTKVFADPIEREGVTVIPVSRACWGFGGGEGTQGESQAGAGGGGGAMLTPIGYIELRDGSSCFRPIFDPVAILKLGLAACALLLAASLVGRRRR